MKEKGSKYTVDGLLRSVLKTVTVMVIVSQRELVFSIPYMDIIVWAFSDSNYDQKLLAVTWNPKGEWKYTIGNEQTGATICLDRMEHFYIVAVTCDRSRIKRPKEEQWWGRRSPWKARGKEGRRDREVVEWTMIR